MKLRPQPAGPFSDTEAELPAPLVGLPQSDILLGYQRHAIQLLTTTALLVIEKSRRIGLTWGLASYAALIAGASRAAGGMKVWYMGYDQEMAREFIDVVGMWAKAFGMAAGALQETILADEEGDIKAFRVTFASGFEVVALPSVARALRGKQGLVIIDEAAFHKALLEVLKAAIALLMWGGRVVVVSTHDGVANPFNLLLDEVRAGRRKGRTLTITFDDAIVDGLYERVALVMTAKGQAPPGKEAWIADIRDTYGDAAGEELDCIPRAGAGSWLDPAALAACEHEDAGKPELYGGGLVYIGRDVARRRDQAVIHAFELVGDVLWLRERWVERQVSFAAQDEAGDGMFLRYRTAAYWIDQTGMGEKVVEDAQRRLGESRVHGELLTGPARLDLATSLKDRVDRTLIRIPPDPALRTDLRAIRKEGGVSGAIRLVDSEDVHADEFWAAALACRAADTPYQPYSYRPVTRPTLREAAGQDRDRRLGRAGVGGFSGFRGVL